MMSFVDCGRSLFGASDEAFDNLCDLCNYDGINVGASNFCTDCKEWLCFKCTDAHKKMKFTRHHKLLSSRQPSVRRDSVLIAKRATAAENEFDKFHHKRKEDLKKFLSLKDTCAKEIKTDREHIEKEILKWLNKVEEKAMKELNDMASDEQQKLERHISAASTKKQMLETDSKLIKDAMQTSESSQMFAVNVKVTDKLNEYDNRLQDLHHEAKTPLMTFSRNKQLTDILNQIDNLGNLTITLKSRHRLFTSMVVQNSSNVNIKLQDDETTPSITGCEVLPNGQIILCDMNNSKVKLLDSSFTVKDALALQTGPWDVLVINNSSAIITLPSLKQLQYMQLEPSLKSGRVIQLDKMCWGIEVAGEDMYVSLHSNRCDGEVRILDMEGSLKSRIGVNPGGLLNFEFPYYLTQSATTRKIYVSDMRTNTVTCLMSDGSTVYQYNEKDLEWPSGVCVDDEENIIVCGRCSNNVHIVTASGRKHGCLLTSKNGIREPKSVAYRHTDDTLIIGCEQNDLFVCKMTS